ncbi:hypothetical protein M407DRAFT_246469 [Tulasnella calospora MUT 4182]|uniref:Uncharacterized protein n=1 Tax=Tulasnella calospora MUT 4182 TaxID=1051891 RepID=A0A0C3LAL8_9AGAM|nr:hypothetical protein M407DRAFT_246469 [Tulasnella calospora MUT 4182]
MYRSEMLEEEYVPSKPVLYTIQSFDNGQTDGRRHAWNPSISDAGHVNELRWRALANQDRLCPPSLNLLSNPNVVER